MREGWAGAAAGIALFALGACASNNADGPGRQDILVDIAVRQAIGLSQDLLTIYGVDIPQGAGETIVATRVYAEALCDVAVDGAEPSVLVEPRGKMDIAFNQLTADANIEPVLMVAIRRVRATALDVTEVVLVPDLDGSRFAAPCERLRNIPEILPRA